MTRFRISLFSIPTYPSYPAPRRCYVPKTNAVNRVAISRLVADTWVMRMFGAQISPSRLMCSRCTHVLVLAVLMTIGCTSQRPASTAASVTSEDLLAGRVFVSEQVDTVVIEPDTILAVDADMRAFIDAYIDPDSSRYLRLQQLLRAIISDGSFGLVYEDSTRTAADTFASRSGNCLSFTNLFIAMARATGQDVRYQEVEIPPDWSMRGDTFVLSRHVNVHVNLGASGEHVVDFNIDDFKSTYERRDISDQRAFAHFYNNKGVEQLQAGRYAAAFGNLRAALAFDPEFAAGWSNLGSLYNRAGQSAYAEAAYLEALRLEPSMLLAMSNLSRLYETMGDDERAEYYRDQVTWHRNRNPYYRYSLARQAFLDRDYEQAIDHLEFAVRKKKWEDSFYFLMGLSYLQLGDERSARRWLEKAEKIAQDDALKRNYQSKIDLLLSSQPSN
jgi:Flp pilus assembly protein TadD